MVRAKRSACVRVIRYCRSFLIIRASQIHCDYALAPAGLPIRLEEFEKRHPFHGGSQPGGKQLTQIPGLLSRPAVIELRYHDPTVTWGCIRAKNTMHYSLGDSDPTDRPRALVGQLLHAENLSWTLYKN